jgi:hypothetical protein
MKVAIATGDWVEGIVDEGGAQILGGSGHVRIGQYIPYSAHDIIIGELAWHPDTKLFGVRDWWGTEHWDFDLLLMQRWMHYTIPARIKEARKRGQIIVNDLDDWYWGLSEKNLAWHSSHPKVNKEENINHYKKSLIKSNAVIVSTQYLADRMSQFMPKKQIYVMENHVDIDRFTPRVHTESEKPVIGWVGSTGHRTGGDLEILKYQYNLLESHNPGRWGFHHSGHVGWYTHFYNAVGRGKDEVTILTPVPGPQLQTLMVFDIGVVPLEDVPFNRAKSWIKGLEYAAAGIPFLASPVMPYIELKKRYNVGWVQKRMGDWEASFESLRDPALRTDVAAHNLHNIQALDTKYGAAKWDAILSDIVANA